ncbi:MFS transporter [Cupriavidus taiwanensis]|uniref:Major facilitator transporter n=1 Tax=Cupriavidus taiwanensis TaxID=164546 RepID=A0A975WZM6_9BURK|nr:MFS transporter [Cupriavidus taiwanensis]MDK3024001.1 MFS transporter [Cupriavidus taiwanensis]SOY50121.1 Major facilitator transporter [Cupriavidus taiwanensis]
MTTQAGMSGALLGEAAEVEQQRAEQHFRDHVDRHLARNAKAFLLHGMLGMTGFRLVTAPTFVPAYLYLLSGSKLTVGLVLAAQYAGMAASSIWGATLVEHRQRVMPLIYVVGWLVRGQILGLALSALWLSGRGALVAAALFLLLFGLLNGVQNVSFNYLTSKIIPLARRGRLTALRNFFGGLTAAAVAWMGGRYLVGNDVFGNGYAATFLAAFVLTSLGISALAGMREPALHDVRMRAGFGRRVRELPALLAADRDFVRFFVARALVALGMMAMPFYAIYAGRLLGLDGATLGYLSLAYLLAQTGSNLAWGRVADRHGYRVVFLASIATWIAATAWLLACATLPGFLLAFCGLGAGFGGFFISADNLVMEFGARKDRPMLLAVSDTATFGMMAVGPVIGGLLAQSVHFPLVFVAAIAVKLAAFVLALRIADPRSRRTGSERAVAHADDVAGLQD